MDVSLAGRTAILSGAGAGLGLEIARGLAREGANLVLGDIDDRALAASTEAARALGAQVVGLKTDIRSDADCRALVDLALQSFGSVGILINDAFLAEAGGTFEDAELAAWQAVSEVNLWGSLRMIKAALPALKAGAEGRIININTHGAEKLDPLFGGYTASKAALAHLTRHLAREFGRYGIRVNGVHPGPMDAEPRRNYLTELAKSMGTTYDALDAEWRGRTALGYLATAADVADAVIFLASPAARSITGQALYVDSGEWFH
ncbi:MAG TPA: SDR family oxidoreductase [Alphaproteobacteria bacterium]|nr:SDR family oxidoreductase [Alphaproteobacteria bacterium]